MTASDGPDTADPRAGSWRLAAPLFLVTGFAMYGQVQYGLEHYSPAGAPAGLRWGVAIGAAVGVELIALYYQWHAHDSLLHGATATAARQRRVSYLIALAVAAVNFAHFAPTTVPGAIVFALFSASGPWLWGLHTRRAQHMQLLREGQVDVVGAVFSAERWRAFPLRTYHARRHSIDFGITDPREAWEAYRTEVARQAADQAAGELGGNVLDELDPPDLDPADEGEPDVEPGPVLGRVDDWAEWTADAGSGSPAYLDDSLPLERRVDLARAAERAAGRPTGQQAIADLLGTTRHKIRDVDERRASTNGHHRQESTP